MDMMDTLLKQNPAMKFFVCYPPPAFVDEWGIRDSVIVNGVMPAVDSILKHYKMAYLIDFYHAFADSAELFPDHIHPNLRGSIDMAKVVTERMAETGMISSVINTEIIKKCFLECYPNPAGDVVNVKLKNIQKGKFHWEVVDCNGNIVLSESESLTGLNGKLTVGVEGVRPGYYVMLINSGDKKFVTIFLKSN